MNLKKIVEDLGMHVKTGADNLDVDVTGGYASDLLSVENKKYVMSSKMVGVVLLGTPLVVGPVEFYNIFYYLDSYGVSLAIMATF